MTKAFLFRRRGPALVLADPAATRSLFAIIAILTFLAALAAAGAEIVAASSREWRSSLSQEATVQLRPQAGRDIEADLARAAALGRSTPGVREARIVSKAEAEALLEPWLGRGLDLSSLPVPRLVVLRLDVDAPALDLAELGRRIAAEIPGASVDDHGAWRARLSGLANTVIGVAAGLVMLILAASGVAVGFATRGAMAGSRDLVDVLQLVGADQRFIVREFALRFLQVAAAAASCGAAAAAIAAPLLGSIASLATATDAASEAFLGSGSIGWRGYALIAFAAATVAAIAGFVSVVTAKRFLRELRAT